MVVKKRILFDSTILINGTLNTSARSGVYFVCYNILKELIKRNEFEVTLYCDKSKSYLVIDTINSDEILKNVPFIKYSKLDNIIIDWESKKYKNKINKGNKIIRVGIKTILNLLKLFLKVKNKLNLNKEQEEIFKNFDVFLSPVFAIPDEIKNINHIKKYTILYDVIPILFPENYTDMQNKNSWFLKLINSINEDDFYFSISNYTKQDFIKHVKNINPNHITPIPLSTGLEYKRVESKDEIEKVKQKYCIPTNKKYLFSLCTLEPRKNLIFAIKNFIEFIKRNNIDDFVYVLGGGHWEHFIEKVNEAIEDLDKFKDKIIKIGYVEDNDMSALYSGAEMFTFPSIYEGFGMPILEAMYCGCPVITSNVTSMPEVIGDCGIQINPENDEELIKAFEKMYFDNEFRDKCIEKGLKRAKEFSWEKCVDVITKEILKNE